MKAIEYMKKELNPDGSRKYTDSQIALVKVAIEYHEVYENKKNECMHQGGGILYLIKDLP